MTVNHVRSVYSSKPNSESANEVWYDVYRQIKAYRMIRYRLKELIAEKEFQDGKRLTLEKLAKDTGLHRTTLSKIANNKGYNATTDILDKF